MNLCVKINFIIKKTTNLASSRNVESILKTKLILLKSQMNSTHSESILVPIKSGTKHSLKSSFVYLFESKTCQFYTSKIAFVSHISSNSNKWYSS